MTDTVSLQAVALATLEAAISGVTHAFAQPPDAIEGNLPCFINLPQASNDTWSMSDDEAAESNESRNWECRLYVAEKGQATLGELVRRCEPFYDSCRDAFQGHQSLGRTAGVLRVTYQGDSGLLFNRMVYNQTQYSGIVFRVQVLTRVRTPYAAGE